jgi:hypothetical protein
MDRREALVFMQAAHPVRATRVEYFKVAVVAGCGIVGGAGQRCR